MAAVAQQIETVNITVNDIPLTVPKGELIVEAVKRLGLEIPIFCYHPRMKPVGMCRMCLVEVGTKMPDGTVRMMPKPQTGCTLPASEGLVILTDTERLHKDRKGVLEFLLINHPLDCPICDRGGECPLQNNTLFYGPSTSRYLEIKRHLPKAYPLSEYVTLDLERCIQCGRCVRFTEEISGDSQLAFRFRGASMQPSTFELRNFESKFSGNVIEICPVGALTSSKYRFRARPWDLETKPAICTVCSNGCNIWFDYRAGKMARINGRTNEAVNEEWTCDRGKFGHEFYNSDARLTVPLVRKGDALVATDWAEAYSEILRAFRAAGSNVAAIGGASNSNEDIFLLQRLFRREFGSPHLDHRFQRHLPTYDQRPENRIGGTITPNTIASLESEPAILVFGSSLADELPIVYLRVRKGWFRGGTKVIVAHHAATDADSFAHAILRYRPGTEAALAAGLAGLVAGTTTTAAVSAETGANEDALSLAVAEIKKGIPTLTTRGLLDAETGPEALRHLADLAKATNGKFNLYGLEANDEGAHRLGMLPDTLPGGAKASVVGRDTDEILQGCIDGAIQALWLVNADVFGRYKDQELLRQAIEAVPFLVVQGTHATEADAYASVVLPQAAPAESDGTFTNVEGRVQRFRQILQPKGQAKPGWRIFSEISLRLRPETPFFNPGEVMHRIAEEVPAFVPARYSVLPEEGVVL
jgi:NADH-quinone oxidoreductase subunit G